MRSVNVTSHNGTAYHEKWGFANIRQGAYMFWWLYETTHPDGYESRPMVIWLQVGSEQHLLEYLQQSSNACKGIFRTLIISPIFHLRYIVNPFHSAMDYYISFYNNWSISKSFNSSLVEVIIPGFNPHIYMFNMN